MFFSVKEYIVFNVQYDLANAAIFSSQRPTSVLEIDAVNYMSTEQKMSKSRTISTIKTNTWSLNIAIAVSSQEHHFLRGFSRTYICLDRC